MCGSVLQNQAGLRPSQASVPLFSTPHVAISDPRTEPTTELVCYAVRTCTCQVAQAHFKAKPTGDHERANEWPSYQGARPVSLCLLCGLVCLCVDTCLQITLACLLRAQPGRAPAQPGLIGTMKDQTFGVTTNDAVRYPHLHHIAIRLPSLPPASHP